MAFFQSRRRLAITAKIFVTSLLVATLLWALGLFVLMHHVKQGMAERTMSLTCRRPWSLTCEYALEEHGALENWLFGIAAELRLRKFMPCDYLFNQEQSFAPYPSWLHYVFPIRLCPVGW